MNIFTITMALLSLVFHPDIQDADDEKNWQMYTQTSGVKFFYRYSECNDTQNGTHYGYYLLKVVNTNSRAKTVSWSQELSYDGKGYPSETVFSLNLNPGGVAEGTCGDTDMNLRIFVRFLNYQDQPELTSFELNNIIISDLNQK